MNCCDDFGACTQGPGCPVRKAKMDTNPHRAQVLGHAIDIVAMTHNQKETLTYLLELIYDAGYNEGRASVMQEQLRLMETT